MTMPPSGPQTGSGRVRDAIAAVANTVAQPFRATVFRARVSPVKPSALPTILVYGYDETMMLQTLTPNGYQGTTVGHMVVRVTLTDNDPQLAETRLEQLAAALRAGVLQSPELLGETLTTASIERVLSVRLARQFDGEGETILADAMLDFEMQWSEEYAVPEDPTDRIDITMTYGDSTIAGAAIDLSAPTP